MKKIIFTLMIGAIVALTSCSKSDDAPTAPHSGDQRATFTIEAPATRATVTDLTRYIVEAYEGKDLTAAPLRVEAATGSLTLSLKKNTDYTFVFWADKGTAKTESVPSSGYYNTDDLKAVTVSTGKQSTIGEAAYCFVVSFNSKDFEANKSVKLKNATAQVNFVEAAGLTAAGNTLSVTYSSGCKLNVATGAIEEVTGEVSRTFSGIAQTAKNGNVATDYILAPLGEKRLVDLKVTFNTEAEKSITAVPFQQSFKTNIKGEYSNMYASTFSVSNEVEDYTENPDVEFPEIQIGDDESNVALCTALKKGDDYYEFGIYGDGITIDEGGSVAGVGDAIGFRIRFNAIVDGDLSSETYDTIGSDPDNLNSGEFYVQALPNADFNGGPINIITQTAGSITISRTDGVWDIKMECRADDGTVVKLSYKGEANDLGGVN